MSSRKRKKHDHVALLKYMHMLDEGKEDETKRKVGFCVKKENNYFICKKVYLCTEIRCKKMY